MCSNASYGLMGKNFESTQSSLRKMKMELENLESHFGSVSKDLCSLDDFQRLDVEEELIRIRRMCEGFSESLIRLTEDHGILSEREGRIAERYAKLDDDHLRMVNEKNSTISELKRNLNKLKIQIETRDVIVEVCEQKIKEKDKIIEAFEEKIKCRDSTIDEMKLQQLEFQGTIEELRRNNLEACKAVEDLRCQKLECDKSQNATQPLYSRFMRLEEVISNRLIIKIDDLINLIENGGVTFLGSKGTDGRDVNQPSQAKFECGGTNDIVESSPLPAAESRCPQSNNRGAYPVRGSKRLRGSDINNVFEMIDNDDECQSSHRKQMISESTVQGGDACTKNSSTRLSWKRKRSSAGSEDLDDESCSDSCINALIESIKSQTLHRTWMFEADMKKAFEEDDSLCLNAVCVLYRQQILRSKSTADFYHFKEMSGKTLAEYLIDGDPDVKLRKSALEVKQERPDVIDKCRMLAIAYHERLCSMYCTRKGSLH